MGIEFTNDELAKCHSRTPARPYIELLFLNIHIVRRVHGFIILQELKIIEWKI